jgi:hypothetical protein
MLAAMDCLQVAAAQAATNRLVADLAVSGSDDMPTQPAAPPAWLAGANSHAAEAAAQQAGDIAADDADPAAAGYPETAVAMEEDIAAEDPEAPQQEAEPEQAPRGKEAGKKKRGKRVKEAVAAEDVTAGEHCRSGSHLPIH